MRKRIGLGLVVLLACAMLCGMAAADEGIPPYGLTIVTDPAKPAELRAGPSAESALIATYHGGVFFEEAAEGGAQDGWVYVRVGNPARSLGGVEGYMRQEYLLYWPEGANVNMEDQDMPEIGIARVPEGETYARVWEWVPGPNVEVCGGLYDGAMMEVLGAGDGFSHVSIGVVNGFMEDTAVELTGKKTTRSHSAHAEGFAALMTPDAEKAGLRLFPDTEIAWDNGQEKREAARNMYLYSASDKEAQVGFAALRGFLPLDGLRLYWFDDLFAKGGRAVPDGEHTVGKDVPPGMYLYTLADGETGGVATVVNDVARAYGAKDAARFLLYLPEGMEIALAGGTLRRASLAEYFEQGAFETFEGTGKVMPDPGRIGTTFYVKALDGADEARVTVMSLPCEEGVMEPVWQETLKPGQETGVTVYPGESIWVENCAVTAGGNG